MRARSIAAPALVFLALALAMGWRIWWPDASARRAFNYDALWQYWGDLQLQLDAYARGELPLWNPHDRCGYPVHADPQAGLLYPVNWMLLALAAITGPTWWLIPVKSFFHLWLAGVGIYAFLRRRGAPVAACYAGGVILLLTHPFAKTLWTALNWSMAWAPWMLLAVDAWAERPSARRGAGVALAFAMPHLAWSPAASFYALLVAVPYGAWAFFHNLGTTPDRAGYLRAAARTASGALLLFVALVAAQYSSTSDLVAHTVRATRDLAFIGDGVFSPDDLFGMVVPRMPGEGLYLGILTVLWVAVALTARPTARTLVLGGVAVLGVLCAWGNGGPFLPFLASLPLPFDLFRRAQRYLYVTALPLAILAAEGLAALLASQADAVRVHARRALLGAAGLGLLVFGAGAAAQARLPATTRPFLVPFLLAIVSTLAAAVAVHLTLSRPSSRRPRVAAACVALLALDLFAARFPFLELNYDPVPRTPRDAEVESLVSDPAQARVYDRRYLKYRPGTRLGIRDFGGYEGDPLALSRYEALRQLFQRAPQHLGHANVAYLLDGPGVPRLPASMPAVRPGVSAVSRVAPAVFWTSNVEVVRDRGAALAALIRTEPGTTAVVEEVGVSAETHARLAALARADAPVPPQAGRVTSLRTNRIAVEIDAPAEGVVVVHEAFYPGWSVAVDGKPAELLPANVLFRGVTVEAGRHVVEMSYRPRGYLALASLSLAGLVVALAVLVRRPR